MNPSSLHALVIDQHCRELAPEVADLLESYLAENAAARAEAERVRSALAVTEETVLRHPELAPIETAASRMPRRGRFSGSWLARAASIAALAMLTGAGGFALGQKQARVPAVEGTNATDAAPRPPRKDSPWARYRFASERGGPGMQIVRVEAPASKEGTLQ